MIKLRLSTFEANQADTEIQIVSDESVLDAVKRSLEGTEVTEDPKEILQVLLNGHRIEADLWEITKLKSSDIVLIAPLLTDGDSNQMMGQILVIAAVFAASYFTAGLATGGAWAQAGAMAIRVGATVVASMLASQLFPPPILAGQEKEGSQDSQMYSINSQSNGVKKFGTVPKVYGTHRIFPNVAANPYTELEVDPATGKLVQYFYCVYDFGFGPNVVSDIKIGNTSISDYTDVTYKLVDFNRPVTDEGDWDTGVNSSLTLYKGDFSSEDIGTEMNGNRDLGSPISQYQVIRNAGSNPDLLPQEITLTFVNPAGLYALDSKGNFGTRYVDLEIHYSKVNENVWIPYNDSNYVQSYSSAGGDTATEDMVIELKDPTNPFEPSWFGNPYGEQFFYQLYNTSSPYVSEMLYGSPLKTRITGTIGQRITNGLGQLYFKTGTGTLPGDLLRRGNQDLGIVYRVLVGYYTGYDLVFFNTFSPRVDIPVWNYVEDTYVQSGPGYNSGDRVTTVTGSLTGVISRRAPNASRLIIAGATRDQKLSSVKFTPKVPGEYKVRIVRSNSRSYNNSLVVDALTVLNIASRIDTTPIVTQKRHTFLELKIKATGQLNGSIQNLSAICTSVLDTWDGTTWTKMPTNNPAWVFTDIMTGEVAKKPIDKTRLHLPSLLEWSEYCDEVPTSGALYTYVEKRYTSNFILDFETTIQSLLAQVSGSAQASLNMVDGKYGVLLDVNRLNPVQVFTPRNSNGFSSSKVFTSRPHALKVSYIDPNSAWSSNEVVVYDDTYTALNATDFEEIQTFACTQVEQAWRFGRYFLAQNKLRQETMTLKVDFENLVCTRGDYVVIVQDAMMVGGNAARVKTVSGNQITIDEGLETGPLSYGFTFRSKTGEINSDTLTVVNSTTFNLVGPNIPEVGDLIVIGEVGSITYDCIVKAITPQDNFTAILTLVEKAGALYTIETTDTIPGYDPRISSTVNPDFSPPSEVQSLQVVANSYNIKSSSYEYYVDLAWGAPIGVAYELFEIHVDDGGGYDLYTSTASTGHRVIVETDKLGIEHHFKVIAVSATGKKLTLGEVGFVSATPLRKTSRPSSVTIFNSDITGEVIQLFWQRIADLDANEYIVRYSPDTDALWEESTLLMRVSSNTSLIATQARTGTYFIKASDFNGNESLDSAAVITTIPNLFGLNVITTTSDFPALTGSKDRVSKFDTSLLLSQAVMGVPGFEQYYPEGYYYYQDLLDLGEIYSVRLQSIIRAEGYVSTDIMSNWITLDSVLLMYSTGSSAWDVETQYRTTATLNVMADWTTLSSVLTISQGAEDIWTAWKKFIIGDATGRIFQFRLKLISNVLNVSPRVLSAEIKSDMPDRQESYNNLVAPDTGLTVTYSPAFKGPGTTPNIQITIENGASGDYFTFTSKTLDGFTIYFYDKLNNPVSRQFDAHVKGYGRKALSIL